MKQGCKGRPGSIYAAQSHSLPRASAASHPLALHSCLTRLSLACKRLPGYSDDKISALSSWVVCNQGTHTAMKSGMLAAEAAFTELTSTSEGSTAPADLAAYEDALKSSWVWEELERERNIRPSYVPLPLLSSPGLD